MARRCNPGLLWWVSASSVAVVLMKVLVSGVTLTYAGKSVVFGTIDGGLVAAVLTPTLGALVAAGHRALRDTDGDGKPDAP